MRISLVILLIFGISLAQVAYSHPSNADLMKREEALEYLLSGGESGEDSDDFSKRSPIRSGPEQRREAREKFEEKCKRSIIHKSRKR
jgi:hypothetical protein